MSYRSGYGGGYPSKKPMPTGTTSKGYSMNAVPPPSSLSDSRRGSVRPNVFTNIGGSASSGSNVTANGLSKQGYSTMNSIAQNAETAQYSIGNRKSKTEDE